MEAFTTMMIHALACSMAAVGAGSPPQSAGLLADLPTLKNFSAGRHSSYDRTGGNMDGCQDEPIQPGETRTIAQMDGAGAITHIWMTIMSKDDRHLKNFVLRMYWDGEDAPSVESPLGDFFGLGHNRYYHYASLPIQIGTTNGLNCFWRMPYSNGARVTVTNEGPIASRAFYYYVDYQKYAGLSPDTARFHAQYRQEYPPTPGQNYVILDAAGRGHYVGCNLSIHNRADGWWGEGDDMIYVDGEDFPSLHGTGSEDYFCGAWSYSKPFSNPYFGCPLLEGGHTRNALWNVYRYHLEDPIPFTKSIRVTIEHGHANNRDDDFSSVAYWYQTEPHVAFGPLPAPEDRLPSEATVFTEAWAEEVERMKDAFESDEVVEQSMEEFGNHWSHGKQLLFQAKGPTVYRADLPIEPGDAGIHDLVLWYTAGPDYGQVELWLNGSKICEWDGYDADGPVRRKWSSEEPITLLRGGNTVELRVVGKTAASRGFLAGWDCFRLHERMAWWEIPSASPAKEPEGHATEASIPQGASNSASTQSNEGNQIVPAFEDILKIDVHAHFFNDNPEFVEMLRRNSIRVVNICFCGNKPEWLEPLEERVELIHHKYRPSFFFASTFDVTRREDPGYANEVIAWLDKSFEAGAVMTKIWKEVGMELRTPNGEFVMPDDPVFDPIFEHLVKRGKPLMAHFADPIEAWQPLDPNSINHHYYSNNPEWHVYGRDDFPSHERIMAAADRILVKHPQLVVIGAHLGSMEFDLDTLAKRFDRYPNLFVDVSARTPALIRQPATKVRDFFIKYQDRILYGVDAGDYTPGESESEEQRITFTENMERHYRQEYVYYSGKGKQTVGRREVDCLGLPREVLEKFYHRNAQRLIPALADPD